MRKKMEFTRITLDRETIARFRNVAGDMPLAAYLRRLSSTPSLLPVVSNQTLLPTEGIPASLSDSIEMLIDKVNSILEYEVHAENWQRSSDQHATANDGLLMAIAENTALGSEKRARVADTIRDTVNMMAGQIDFAKLVEQKRREFAGRKVTPVFRGVPSQSVADMFSNQFEAEISGMPESEKARLRAEREANIKKANLRRRKRLDADIRKRGGL